MSKLRLVEWAIPMWRSPGVLQLGIEAGSPIIEDAPDQALTALLLLRKPSTTEDVYRSVPDLPGTWFESTIRALTDAGVVVNVPNEKPSQILLAGSGLMMNDIAGLLARESVQLSWLQGSGFRPPPGVRIKVVEHWEAVLDMPPLTLIVPRTIEPDRALTDLLVREGMAHLTVRSENSTAVVGPMVVPGVFPCTRCLDLGRRDRDEAWPYLLAQLALRSSQTSRSLRWWAAATAVSHALTFLAGEIPESAGRTVELASPPTGVCAREWSHHPECWCTQIWSATIPSTASA